jgi:hypothetical protein
VFKIGVRVCNVAWAVQMACGPSRNSCLGQVEAQFVDVCVEKLQAYEQVIQLSCVGPGTTTNHGSAAPPDNDCEPDGLFSFRRRVSAGVAESRAAGW